MDPEYVFQVDYQDSDAPSESYTYSIVIPGMIEQDLNDDTVVYDYNAIYNGFQIKKSSIDDLVGAVIITISNTSLGTATSFTLTP